jgi:hypothetical protein
MIAVKHKTFSVSKKGNTDFENEDCFVAPSAKKEDTLFRFAVSDGATESAFAKEWADLLVSYFYDSGFNTSTFEELQHPTIRTNWLARIDIENLPWYLEEKLQQGAFATFLGIETEIETGQTTIIAAGDSVFFHFREDQLIYSFPIEKSPDFSNTPFLISTEYRKNKSDQPLFSEHQTIFLPDDFVVLSTDAIGYWILTGIEQGNNPADLLKNMLLNEKYTIIEFQAWLEDERIQHRIKNDDSTIVLFQIKDGTTER